MAVDNPEGTNYLCGALLETVSDYLVRRLPQRRIVLVTSILKNCGIETSTQDKLTERLLEDQNCDGGWVDCEDTAWSLYYLSKRKDCESNFNQGLLWLESERRDNKGWGFCKRDRSCIPITALISYLLPETPSVLSATAWLENEWSQDLHSPINLNYKAAWYLLAFCKHHQSASLSQKIFNNTISYLLSEQRSDGSWGPWKTHPAPSECYITGICMAALALSYPVSGDKRIIPALTNGMRWIQDNQLENGLFPTHYIEEGSAWIYFGWSKAIAAMQGDCS